VRSLALVLGVALLAGCGQTSSSTDKPCTEAGATSSNGNQVLLDYYAFIPRCFAVVTNTTVTFLNLDDTPHTVTTDPGQVDTFDSGELVPGGVFTHTFTTAGDIGLHCTLFPGMTATAYVRAP